MAHRKKFGIRGASSLKKKHSKRRKRRHLYIIGNGFDLHHFIPSKYEHFRAWLEENDEDTLYRIEEILGTDGPAWWNEFETNLGRGFAVKLYAESVAFQNHPDYGSDDYRDRDLYVAEYEVEQNVGELVNDLRCDFQEWASLLPTGDGGRVVKMETKKSCFLTFNYTLTLEKLYNVPSKQILHIHGHALDKNTIIVGHGRDYSSFRNELDDDLPEPPDDLNSEEYERWYDEVVSEYSDDYPTSQAKDAAAFTMVKLRKDVEGIIAKNKDFFKSLHDIGVIHIYGFSFAEVDIPYLMEVAKYVDIGNVVIEISYYYDEDKVKADKFLLKVESRPKNMKFVKLEELMRYKELELF